MEPSVELFQFLYSPYNEKARWALDLKNVPHRRTSLLPGPHIQKVRGMTGQTATPVLRLDGEAIAGSARIIERLDALYPEPRLIPDGAAERERALSIERRFDEEWTPRMRRAVLDALLTDYRYFARVFGADKTGLKRFGYGCVLPLARGLICKGNGITGKAAVEDGVKAIAEAFDFVARETNGTGYLVGGRFTVADLTAASSLASVADPPHPDMARPQPMPPALAALIERNRNHPGRAWVMSMYERHRPACSAKAKRAERVPGA